MTNPLFLIDQTNDDTPMNSDGLHIGWHLTLPPAVRRHALQSMRLRDGDELQLSNGKGLRIHAQVCDENNGEVRVTSFETEDLPLVRLQLVQALAKNGHDEQAIDVATQIGVDSVVPWQADRSIARWKAGRTDRKWQAVLHAATEQSRRAWEPQLEDCHTSKQLAALCRTITDEGGLMVVLHQDATATWSGIEQQAQKVLNRAVRDERPRTISVVVGPEGGIGDQEIEMFKEAGAQVALLGHNILRASSAGPVALSLLSRTLGRIL
ncbi:16S rRNA (uracil(1498)-N(3))-methyltransferase [Bifidobacterium magnum]|uniref:Ribosomal RNA small subunit methyltransferase E n=1 Tax=Bifidobacterium magnum TaxID=1692 RepID=A0A087B6B2_9BIFI|nr:16S rRNA (uracil(1498)-N(3))-methyltransferase [Bifidobacterium magnum]KFI66562.1 16S ribosomal RNA methyltransferase [Bifidobacterium magnum]